MLLYVLLVLRLLGPFLPLQIIKERPEISTPVNSYKRLQEGLFLFDRQVDPYQGSIFYQSPLLIPVYYILPEIIHFLIPVLFDLFGAYSLYHLAIYRIPTIEKETWLKPEEESKQDNQKKAAPGLRHRKNNESDRLSPIKQKNQKDQETIPPKVTIRPEQVAIWYLGNPFTLLACWSQTTGCWETASLLGALMFASKEQVRLSMLMLSFATVVGLYPIVGIVPCLMLIHGRHIKSYVSSVALFLLFVTAWLCVSFVTMNSLSFIPNVYGTLLLVPDLTPNIGLYWYFFIEMFEQFRNLFLFVFQILALVVFAVPVAIRFRKDSVFVAYVLITIAGILRSYPSATDVGLALSLLPLFPDLIQYASGTYVMSMLIATATVFMPVFHQLWLYSGSGNANFYYALTLVLNGGLVGWLTEMTKAKVIRQEEQTAAKGQWRELRLAMAIY